MLAAEPLQGRLLLATANVELRQQLQPRLQAYGIDLISVEAGQAAVEHCLEAYFDLSLIDAALPDLSGVEAIELLRGMGFSKPLVLLMPADRGDDLDTPEGADARLNWPCADSELDALLKRYLSPQSLLVPAETTSDAAPMPPSDGLTPRMRELMQEFEASLPATLAQIDDLMLQEDWQQMEALVHKLKGCAGSLGHPQLTDKAQDMLQAVRANQYFDICAQYGEVARYIRGLGNR